MFQWRRRLMEMPDRERARMFAKLAFWFVMILLYVLGGISLYLRARYLGPEPNSVAPTAAVVVSPAMETSEPPTAFPTATSLPTATPQTAASETLAATATLEPVATETPFPSPTPGISLSATQAPPTATASPVLELPSATAEVSTPPASATPTETATPGPLGPPPTSSQN